MRTAFIGCIALSLPGAMGIPEGCGLEGCEGEPIGGPGGINYSQPGSSGSVPEDLETTGRVLEYSVYSPFPNSLVCGQTYKLTVGARQKVFTCQEYNYTSLYDRAVKNAAARAAELSCPNDCVPMHTWIIARVWGCLEAFGPPTAFATVQMGILCPRPTDPKPKGLCTPAQGALQAPAEEPGTKPNLTSGSSELLFEEIGDFMLVQCGTELGTTMYLEKVADCNNVKDYEPYVQRAVDRAKFHYNLLSCQTPCKKQPYKELRTEWTCDQTGSEQFVNVSVFYQIECKQP